MRAVRGWRIAATLALGFGTAFGQSPDPATTFVPLGESSYRLDWTGEDGWTYFFQYSTNLVDWFYLPEVDQGVVHDPFDVTPTYEDEITLEIFPYPRYFMRLALSNFPSLDPKGSDHDGDGVSNWKELTLYGSDPLKQDTDGDGLPDGQEDTDGDGISDQWEQMLIEQSENPGSLSLLDITAEGDFDGDGILNFQEYLSGLSGYQTDSDGDGYSDGLSVGEEVFLRLDESSGVSAGDSSSEERDGTLGGSPDWLPAGGIEGGSLEFNGGSDVLELPEDVLDGAADLTISLWFKTSVSPAGQTLVSSASAAQSPELAVTLEDGHTVRFHAGGGSSVAWTYGRSLADGRWHHLVVTRDLPAGLASLALDGAFFGSGQAIPSALVAMDSVALGQRHASVSGYDPLFAFTGFLDNVRVHSKALDEEDLAELFRPNDLDSDGLPDDWETALTGNLASLAASGDDPDGDGLSNRQEYEGGTDPNDYYNGVTPVVTLVTGSGQTIYNGERTKNPLVFKVTTDGTTPLVGAPLLLEHLELIGSIETVDGDTLATALTLKTGDDGLVKVHFKAD